MIFHPKRIWNCDETGLMFVNKPKKNVTSFGEKATTLLACIDATGCYIPPFITFKGVRIIPQLTKRFMPNTQVRFFSKGMDHR